MYKQSAHGLKGLRTFPVTSANAIASVPVCADDDCMQCAMGLYCANAPVATAKPRVRVCASWTAERLENEILRALLPSAPANIIVTECAATKNLVSAMMQYTDAELSRNFVAAEQARKVANAQALYAPALDAMRSALPAPKPHVAKPAGTSKSSLARAAAFARRAAAHNNRAVQA